MVRFSPGVMGAVIVGSTGTGTSPPAGTVETGVLAADSVFDVPVVVVDAPASVPVVVEAWVVVRSSVPTEVAPLRYVVASVAGIASSANNRANKATKQEV